MLETEYTAIVPDPEELLRRVGPVQLLWEGYTRDTYYDRDGDLAAKGSVLRLREKFPKFSGDSFDVRDYHDFNVYAELTWKGPKRTTLGGAKERAEHSYFMTQLPIQIEQLQEVLLLSTGLRETRTVEREIRLYRFPDLDSITFRLERYPVMYELLELEVHGASDVDVQEAMTRLALTFSDRSLASYVLQFEQETGQTANVSSFHPLTKC